MPHRIGASRRINKTLKGRPRPKSFQDLTSFYNRRLGLARRSFVIRNYATIAACPYGRSKPKERSPDLDAVRVRGKRKDLCLRVSDEYRR